MNVPENGCLKSVSNGITRYVCHYNIEECIYDSYESSLHNLKDCYNKIIKNLYISKFEYDTVTKKKRR